MWKKASIIIIAFIVLYLIASTIYQYPALKGKSKDGEWTVWIQRDATDPKRTYSGYLTSPQIMEYEDVKYLYESDGYKDKKYEECEFDLDGYEEKGPILIPALLGCKTRKRYMFLTYASEVPENVKMTIMWKDHGKQKKETIKLN